MSRTALSPERAAPAGEIELRVIGMTCGGCVAHVESALREVSGVEEAVVNLMTESALVRGPADATSRLIDAVRQAGYDAEPMRRATAASADETDAEQREQLRQRRQALVMAVMYGLPILMLEHFGHSLQAGHAAGQLGWRLLQAALLVLLVASPAGAPVLIGGLRAALHRTSNMELLITLGVTAATLSSLAGTILLRAEFIHYHAAAMILLLVCLGRYLESRARASAASAMAAIARRAAAPARVRRGDEWTSIPTERIVVGDEVRIAPHESVPVDGVVIDGEATIDESLMTGEPFPVTRRAGDALIGGSMVQEGTITMRATRVGRDATVGRIAEMVRKASATRTRMQRLADGAAALFTPIVVALAAATFIGWLALGGSDRLAPALSAAVAVLVVACPCAMGLAAPTVVVVATGQAALRGILVRDAESLETLGRVRRLFWDKTGTLTAGRPQWAGGFAEDENELLRLAASVEQLAVHPLARAIVDAARRRGLTPSEPVGFRTTPGGGVEGTVDGRLVRVGSAAYCTKESLPAGVSEFAAAHSDRPHLLAYVAINGRVIGVTAWDDPPRPSAAAAIRRLARLGVRQTILTGDSAAGAAALLGALNSSPGFDTGNPGGSARADAALPIDVIASLDPTAKVEAVRSARQADSVAMVGDGANDAAALAAADVGVAFATGAELARAAAGVHLIGSTPQLAADAVELARRSDRIIRQNLFWAVIYNILMIPLAAVGRLDPGWAAGAMMLSSLTVVLNSLRLRVPRRATQ